MVLMLHTIANPMLHSHCPHQLNACCAHSRLVPAFFRRYGDVSLDSSDTDSANIEDEDVYDHGVSDIVDKAGSVSAGSVSAGSDREDSDSDCSSDNVRSMGSILRAARRAGKSGSTAAVEALLSQGVSPDAADQTGTTPLMIAAGYGNVALTTLLLAAGANVNASNCKGATTLMQAVDQPASFHDERPCNVAKRLACINALLAAGAHVNARDATGMTALMYASQHDYHGWEFRCDDAPYVRALLANSAEVNAADADGWTALMTAIDVGAQANGHASWSNPPTALRFLLAAGADVNSASLSSGTTPLMIAARRADDCCTNDLLKAGAFVGAVDSEGNTALMISVRARSMFLYGGPSKVVSSLLRAGADVNATSHDGHTALMIAASCQPDYVHALLAAGADVSATTDDGSTALMLLAKQPWRAYACDIPVPHNYKSAATRMFGASPAQTAELLTEAAKDATSKASAAAVAQAEAEEAAAVLQQRVPPLQLALAAANAVAADINQNRPVHTFWRGPPGWYHSHYMSTAHCFYRFRERDQADEASRLYWDAHKEYEAALCCARAASREAVSAAWHAKQQADLAVTELANIARKSAAVRTKAIRALLDAGADANARRADGSTVLIVAASAEHEHADSRPDLVTPGPGWQSRPCESIVTALIHGGADPNATDDEGSSPLIRAAFWGNVADVRALLASGANIQAADEDSDTALHFAAREGHAAVVSALLAAGADDAATNAFGDTPLQDAFFCGQAVVATLFLVRGPLALPHA